MNKQINLSFSELEQVQAPLNPSTQWQTNINRIDCWKNTQIISETLSPPPSSTRVYWSAEPLSPLVRGTVIHIENEDALDAGLRLQDQGFSKVLVLNLADDRRAGGCLESGSGAQEESLFRRTNYHKTLLQTLYPITADQAIYSPGITVLKASEANEWKKLEPARTMDFIACPGLRYPTLYRNESGEGRIQSPADQVLKRKIETILQTACRESYDAVVLGAMGCGVWQNPSKHVAEIFRQVLEECQGYVPYVVFAIMHKPADGEYEGTEVTCDVFRQVFFDYQRTDVKSHGNI